MHRFKPEKMMEESFRGREVTLDDIESSIENEEILCGRVNSCDVYGGLHVALGTNCVVDIPIGSFDYRTSSSGIASTYVGELVAFVIESVSSDDTPGNCTYKCQGNRKKAQNICKREYIDKLRVGDIIDAYVTGIEKFGLFCDLGIGYTGVMRMCQFSLSRIIDPKTDLAHLKSIKVIVESKCDNGNVYVSHKELLGTWDEAITDFKAGESVMGTVVNIVENKLFISISLNIIGVAPMPDDGNHYDIGDTVVVSIAYIKRSIMHVQLKVISKKNGAKPNLSIRYHYTGDHMDSWVYSNGSEKREVRSVFKQ